MSPILTPDLAFEQDLKPGLFEMVVGGQGIRKAMILHRRHGNAIGERPIFVSPSCIKSEASFEKSTGCREDFELRRASHEFNEFHEQMAIPGSAQCVTKFDVYKFRGNHRAFQIVSCLHGEFMPGIALIDDRDKEGGVSKDLVHCLGRPYR